MSNCARCNGELGPNRVYIDEKVYHPDCILTEAHWRELDRLAEIAMQGLCARSDETVTLVAREAYQVAVAMIAERKRRRVG